MAPVQVCGPINVCFSYNVACGSIAGGRGKLTLFQKYSIVLRLENDKEFKQIHAAKMYNVSPAAICQLLKRRERIKHDYEFGLNPASMRLSSFNSDMKSLDEALLRFVAEQKELGQQLTARTVWEKASEFSTGLRLLENGGIGPKLWKPNTGWWSRFSVGARSLSIPNAEVASPCELPDVFSSDDCDADEMNNWADLGSITEDAWITDDA
jgi:hypothetical protein